jgi:putative flippase GtrA
MRILYKQHQEKISYLLVGGWNMVFGYFIFVLLYYLLATRVHYVILLALSNVLSITNAYIGYKVFVFKTKGNYWLEYSRFYIIYGSALLLNFIFLPLCVEYLMISPPVAQGGLMFISVIFSYYGHKKMSFSK